MQRNSTENNEVLVSLEIGKTDYEKLDNLAKQKKLTVNDVLTEIIERGISEKPTVEISVTIGDELLAELDSIGKKYGMNKEELVPYILDVIINENSYIFEQLTDEERQVLGRNEDIIDTSIFQLQACTSTLTDCYNVVINYKIEDGYYLDCLTMIISTYNRVIVRLGELDIKVIKTIIDKLKKIRNQVIVMKKNIELKGIDSFIDSGYMADTHTHKCIKQLERLRDKLENE